MRYKFLRPYAWSPDDGRHIYRYAADSVHDNLPAELIDACQREPYNLLEVIKDVPPAQETKIEATTEVKIEPEPENKIETAPEKKTVYPIFSKKKKK